MVRNDNRPVMTVGEVMTYVGKTVVVRSKHLYEFETVTRRGTLVFEDGWLYLYDEGKTGNQYNAAYHADKLDIMSIEEEKKLDPMRVEHVLVPGERYKLDTYNMKIYTKDQYCLGGLPNVGMLEEQWEKLPDVGVGYDSTTDTLKHIKRVNELLIGAAQEILKRAAVHDESKLHDPEKEGFDRMTPILKNLKYGSDEYKASLAELKVSLDHHYASNSHHPEHYPNGIDGFDLFDLIEMFFDWKAATERTSGGNIHTSIEYNKKRFNIPDTLANILANTADRMGTKNPKNEGDSYVPRRRQDE